MVIKCPIFGYVDQDFDDCRVCGGCERSGK